MKRLLLLGISIIFAGALYAGLATRNAGQPAVSEPVIPTERISIPTPDTEIAPSYIIVDGRRISYDFTSAAAENIGLVSNMPVSTDSASAMRSNNCSALTSAGFYTKEQSPLGLFRIGSHIFSPEIQSALVDGFVSVSADNHISIGQNSAGPSNSKFIFQSGPLVRIHGAVRPLKIRSDEYARRLVAAVSESQKLHIIVLFDGEVPFSGPLLSQVPDIIESISAKESLGLTDAVNLDGGSASVFITDNRTLGELSPAGGFFCIK